MTDDDPSTRRDGKPPNPELTKLDSKDIGVDVTLPVGDGESADFLGAVWV